MGQQVIIAGAGIAGLSAAIACARDGWEPRVIEQAVELSEIGAGIQLGPNATRRFHAWGLDKVLADVASFPSDLRARDAHTGDELAKLTLGESMRERYGAPYATVHRADLQSLLSDAARTAGADVSLGARVDHVQATADVVLVREGEGRASECDVLVGADGLWSAVRKFVASPEGPQPTGHIAYRAVAAQSQLPSALKQAGVVAWLGPRMHLVAYPVRAGQLLNIVAIIEGRGRGEAGDWNEAAKAADLHAAMGAACAPLRDLVHAVEGWRSWTLHDRPPVRSAQQLVQGRVALVGDAAHPMRPYLAQGAAMAIEDAAELARCLAMVQGAGIDVPLALRRYALNRWQRCARVQAQARRNGEIFHAQGFVRWGRNLSMRVLGERLLDQPWLYGG